MRLPEGLFPEWSLYDLDCGMPYFYQHHPMSCIAASILNACLTMSKAPQALATAGDLTDAGLPLEFKDCESDSEAEDWVIAQLEAASKGLYDADGFGGRLSWAKKVLGPDWQLKKKRVKIQEIMDLIDAGKSVIIGVDLNFSAVRNASGKLVRAWHAITIVKTPAAVQERIPWSVPYSIIDPDQRRGRGSASELYAAAFIEYLLGYGANGMGLYNCYLVGPGEPAEE